MVEFLKEYIEFLKSHKKLWMIPLLAVIVLVVGLAVIGEGGAIAPFLYSLF